MSTDNTLQQEMIGKPVAQGPRAGAGAEAVAEEAVRTWEQIARELAPIIGEGGFRALYTRALHLTKSTYSWLGASQEPAQKSPPFTGLSVSLQRREFTEARDASNALLVTFTELLATFIGKRLTSRILLSVRGDGDRKPAQEARK